MLNPITWLILQILDIYVYILIASVVVSWLVAFGVINTHNSFARSVLRAIYALTEPVLRPIRRLLPAMGGVDLSPLIALLGVYFLRYLVVYFTYAY